MTILLFGKAGQVGWELQRSLTPLGEVTALDRQGNGDLCGDLLDPEGLAATVRKLQPRIIVNAAAYTAVDQAESEPDVAQRANADAPAALAREAAACGALLVHYSSDYVFDGSGSTPWREDDTPGPLNVYGRTKLAGERAIVESGCRHLILRPGWVYSAHGQNFAKTMLRLARERERLTIVDDQWGVPVGAELLADVTAQVIPQVRANPDKAGTYHVAAAGETNWYDYARHVVSFARNLPGGGRFRIRELVPIPSSEYPVPAPRPHNSRLDTRKLRTTFGLTLPPWQAGVERMLTEVTAMTPG